MFIAKTMSDSNMLEILKNIYPKWLKTLEISQQTQDIDFLYEEAKKVNCEACIRLCIENTYSHYDYDYLESLIQFVGTIKDKRKSIEECDTVKDAILGIKGRIQTIESLIEQLENIDYED